MAGCTEVFVDQQLVIACADFRAYLRSDLY
jgi:hypothetical protein